MPAMVRYVQDQRGNLPGEALPGIAEAACRASKVSRTPQAASGWLHLEKQCPMCQADAFVSLYRRDEPNAARVASPSDIESASYLYAD